MNISRITSEQIKQMPELAHLYDAVLFLEKNKGKNLSPKKHESSIIGLAEEDTYDIFKEHPTMPLKEVVAKIVSTFDADLSGELIVKITQKVIETHGKLSKKVVLKEWELETA
jgi:hypothetical protein